MYHQKVVTELWKEEAVSPFDELFLTWNAKRPLSGSYRFYIRLKIDGNWSDLMPYATWGSKGQSGCSYKSSGSIAKVYQDAAVVLRGKRGTGFLIKVESDSDQDVHSLHVYTNGEKKVSTNSLDKFIFLDVAGLSQRTLNHPRKNGLCSPTSTTAVLRHLLKTTNLDPISFAGSIWDGEFDIFGNWVFNVAEATHLLGPSWSGWVERLAGFSEIYDQLEKGVPVVVSIRGPLKGSGTSGKSGHLIVVRGFDPETNRVFCMDPGLEDDEKTAVSFPLNKFIKAWDRRGNLAYMFQRETSPLILEKL